MKIRINLVVALILAGFVMTFSHSISAQKPIQVQPIELYKFIVNNNNSTVSVFLTPSYNEGISKGYTYQKVVGYVFVAPQGLVPAPGSGLNPVHRWKVLQNGRTYYYYTQTFSSQGAGYTYAGTPFYMFNSALTTATLSSPLPQLTFPLHRVSRCYSQSVGFWYGSVTPFNTNVNPFIYTIEIPPNNNFDCNGFPNGFPNIVGGGIFTVRGTRPGAIIQVSEANPWNDDGAIMSSESAETVSIPFAQP
jgi:hypothetical protein